MKLRVHAALCAARFTTICSPQSKAANSHTRRSDSSHPRKKKKSRPRFAVYPMVALPTSPQHSATRTTSACYAFSAQLEQGLTAAQPLLLERHSIFAETVCFEVGLARFFRATQHSVVQLLALCSTSCVAILPTSSSVFVRLASLPGRTDRSPLILRLLRNTFER